MIVEIDSHSGFCFGVVNAVKIAETELEKYGILYCLGEIVHNSVELQRLRDKGLVTITFQEFKKLKDTRVLLRAHGEPPETYIIARENNISIVDASCPVVLKLQKKIKTSYGQMGATEGQLVIFGKEDHAEVNGLVGQTMGKAIVVNNFGDLGKIDFTKPITIFSQTTQGKNAYLEIQEEIKRRISTAGNDPVKTLNCNDSICKQVSSREPKLKEFAAKHDLILFVGSPQSSNGKMLYQVCKEANANSFMVSDINDLNLEWLKPVSSIGICGATSTPRWLMEKIANYITKIQ
jgi:4-hydroxy-3-methylbut-2-en-1-yl diphosphate reductase